MNRKVLVFKSNQLDPSGELDRLYEDKEFGVFETFLIRRKDAANYIIGFERHLRRLKKACTDLKLCSLDQLNLVQDLKDNIKSKDLEEIQTLRVRLDVFRDKYFMTFREFENNFDTEKGISLLTLGMQRQQPDCKTNRTEISVKARQEAEKNNFDEALLIADDGTVREGAWSNFFWISKDNILYTPKNGILCGITREIVMELSEVIEADQKVDFVKQNVKSAFITQSTNGIVPVYKFDDLELEIAAIITDLQKEYSKKEEIFL